MAPHARILLSACEVRKTWSPKGQSYVGHALELLWDARDSEPQWISWPMIVPSPSGRRLLSVGRRLSEGWGWQRCGKIVSTSGCGALEVWKGLCDMKILGSRWRSLRAKNSALSSPRNLGLFGTKGPTSFYEGGRVMISCNLITSPILKVRSRRPSKTDKLKRYFVCFKRLFKSE